MNISTEMLHQKVPEDMFPTRLDSALNLYTNVSYGGKSGLILYNFMPDTWNCLYSFYETNHKFTIDSYEFSSHQLTYGELISEYQDIYHRIYEQERGFIKPKRQQTLADEFCRTFQLQNVEIGDELEPVFELKYSKSKNVWTLYYFENYVASSVDNINKLLEQKQFQQKILPLDPSITEVDGIEVGSNIPYMLTKTPNIQKLRDNFLD